VFLVGVGAFDVVFDTTGRRWLGGVWRGTTV
jgi:hypothetical protein